SRPPSPRACGWKRARPTENPSSLSRRARAAPPSTTRFRRRSCPVSKRRGLPQEARMRHDSHFVEALSSRFGASLGRWIPLEEMETNPGQPRTSVGALRELVKSIEVRGVLEPLLVRPIGDNRYRIIAGERRFRAAMEAGLTEVPCIEFDVPENEVI